MTRARAVSSVTARPLSTDAPQSTDAGRFVRRTGRSHPIRLPPLVCALPSDENSFVAVIPTSLEGVHFVASGVGLHLAVSHLGYWIRRPTVTWPAWFGVSAAAMSVVLVANVVAIHHPGEP